MNIVSGSFHPGDTTSGNNVPKASVPKTEAGAAAVEVAKVKPETKVVEIEVKPKDKSSSKQDMRDAAVELRKQVDELNMTTKNIQRSIRFQVDDNSGSTVVKVVDMATDELIRQIPPEEILTISRKMKNLNEQLANSTGIFLQQEV